MDSFALTEFPCAVLCVHVGHCWITVSGLSDHYEQIIFKAFADKLFCPKHLDLYKWFPL